MATGGSTKSSQGRLICAICLETYRRPKLLPCYHTFCQACLESLAPPPAPTLACPTCRTNILIPPGGATDFQVSKSDQTTWSSHGGRVKELG